MNVVIAAGGTAGHINPGIAIADKIREKNSDAKIHFIGTEYGLEGKLVGNAGYPIHYIHSKGLSKNPIKLCKSMYYNFKGVFEAKEILKKLHPKVVIGMGGYVCGPVLFAAKKMLNLPVFIHESNSIAGKTNKFVGNFADGIAVGFSKTKEDFTGKAVIVTGNPIRQDFMNLTRQLKEEKTVLIFGGSQGARAINNAVVELLSNYHELPYKIVYATGEKQYDAVIDELKSRNISLNDKIEIKPYIDDMPKELAEATIAVSRAGALTLSELEACGVPAILIPLPTAAENHQEKNARMFEAEGRAKVILERELTSTKLKMTIDEMLKSEKYMTLKGISNHACDSFYEMIEGYLKK
ncbi:MAG: undecaprenyldiphospho-muramoylpentapeptide beta-N-acetylglucosaminyltransferase [Clostridia bacterium]|nr:undecaprenyldiphospho-muramoylpentapeptide beta-N-acetylglucosaminyltransferase [Clostridia bacterium]